jgi:hypothetical protein
MHDDEYFNARFWQDEGVWPRDDGNYIFLARAIQRIDTLIHTEPLDRPPELRNDMKEEEWSRVEDEQESYENALLCRRRDAVARFVEAYRQGSFQLFTRPKGGNETQFSRLSEPIWYSENCDHWFHFCDFHSDDGDLTWSNSRPWIFVTRDGFEARFGRSSFIENKLPQPTDQLSPYLRLMIEVVRDLDIGPQNQPKAEIIKKEFVSRWDSSKHKIDLTDHLANSMVTLVREPSSQKGGNKKPKNRGPKPG